MIFEKQVIDMYKKIAYTRCDDKGTAYYFSEDDFEGLNKKSYPFKSSKGHILQGYLYSYDNPIEKRIIVFEHGFFGGHRSYMKEIEMLCRHGYLVLAYDHTGCMESEGETPNGMAQSLCDLNDCISTIKADPALCDFDISVVGHSWGGFSTLNICALHSEISHIVAISGFVSVEKLIGSMFSGLMKGYRKAIMKLEREANPEFVGFNAIDSLSKTNARVLLIYSDNDKLCRKNPHYDMLYEALSDKENVKLLLVKNKGHNPNYTEDAVKYLAEYSRSVSKASKKKKLQTPEQRAEFVKSFDWERMTAQDDEVWTHIFECLDK